jgi:hypothetical protein
LEPEEHRDTRSGGSFFAEGLHPAFNGLYVLDSFDCLYRGGLKLCREHITREGYAGRRGFFCVPGEDFFLALLAAFGLSAFSTQEGPPTRVGGDGACFCSSLTGCSPTAAESLLLLLLLLLLLPQQLLFRSEPVAEWC